MPREIQSGKADDVTNHAHVPGKARRCRARGRVVRQRSRVFRLVEIPREGHLCLRAKRARPAPQVRSPTTPKSANWINVPTNIDKPVDVFYLYPTAFQKASADASNVAAVDDAGMRKGAQSAYARQATAFEDTANI